MKSLANPTTLKPIEDDDLIQVIIETPAQSRNKFAFDPKQSVFALKKVLPAGMVFPYDSASCLKPWPQMVILSTSFF